MIGTRKLGNAGPELTEIGFGAWAIGGPWKYGWGPQDDTESKKAIDAALDLGINWIDTAAVYGLGHSEEVVGEAVTGKRQKVLLATKCGLVWDSNGRVEGNITPESIEREADASLKRLRTDYIDLYQIHWPDRKNPEDIAWEAMLRLKEKGKVRFCGVSNFDVSKLTRCLEKGHIDSLQPPYSLVKRAVERAELPFCEKNGIGVVAYSPMQSGLLSGKFDASRIAKDDWRGSSPYFKEPFLGKAMEFVSGMEKVAHKYGKTAGQLAIAWVLGNSAVTSAIVGARNPGQVEEILGGAGWKIEKADTDFIEKLRKKIFGDSVFQNL